MASSTITIRQITDADRDDLVRLFEEHNRPETTRHFHPFPLTARTADLICGGAGKDRYYIARCGRAVIGFCMLRGWEEGFEIPSFGVLVDRRHRKQGYGRRMLEFALDQALQLNCSRVRLSVLASNAAAVRLYAAAGFRETARETMVAAGEPDAKITMLRELQ